MGKSQRDKGARFERAVVNILKAHDINAQRVPLSGATTFAKGDIMADIRGQPWRFECKARANGFKELYKWIEDNDALVVKADYQEALVVLTLAKFIELAESPKSPDRGSLMSGKSYGVGADLLNELARKAGK